MNGLLADTTERTMDNFTAAYPTVQHVRTLLQSFGFVPLCKVGRCENWCRAGRRVQLCYDGEQPGEVGVADAEMRYATIVRVGDGWAISLD